MRSQQKAYKEMIHHSRDSLFRDVAKRFVRNKAAVLGLIILVVILFVIIFANFLVPEELVTAYAGASGGAQRETLVRYG